MDFFNSRINDQQILIKEQLINNLTENIKEIQFEYKENGNQTLELCDCTNTLCTIIESIFLHGLKDNFLQKTYKNFLKKQKHKTSTSTSGANLLLKRNEKNFWSTLLLITHKNIIKLIENEKILINDIGLCRSWLRLTINDTLLTSHMNLLLKNNHLLTPYYNSDAYLRDLDKLDVTIKLIDIIENYVVICLPYKSSLLNQWSNETLQMSGIIPPDAIRTTIMSGIDVANSLPDDIEIIQNTNVTEEIQTVIEQQIIPDNINNIEKNKSDDNFENLLKKFDNQQPSTSTSISSTLLLDINKKNLYTDDNNTEKIGNLLNTTTSWSTILLTNEQTINHNDNLCKTIIKTPNDYQSYNTLLDKHNNIGNYQRILNYNDLWELFENNFIPNANNVDDNNINDNNIEDNNDDPDNIYNKIKIFDQDEIKSLTEMFTMAQLHDMIEQLCKLSHEMGIDKQNYNCYDCGSPLGIGCSLAARVCTFNGKYYCDDCMSIELSVIPSRIIKNWDFKRYPISKKSFYFLYKFDKKPFINLKTINSHLYDACELMLIIKKKRDQLNFLRNYLYTCCYNVIEKFNELFNKKMYLYENNEMYAFDDFLLIEKGSFIRLLESGIKYGRDHVYNCNLCSQKGFICEICNETKVLYPFDIEDTYRCKLCFTVYHNNCLDATKPCPKCERKKKREDLPLLDVCNIDLCSN